MKDDYRKSVRSPMFFAALYLAFIPLFAWIYLEFIPAGFYHNGLKHEPSYRSLLATGNQQLSDHLTRKYREHSINNEKRTSHDLPTVHVFGLTVNDLDIEFFAGISAGSMATLPQTCRLRVANEPWSRSGQEWWEENDTFELFIKRTNENSNCDALFGLESLSVDYSFDRRLSFLLNARVNTMYDPGFRTHPIGRTLASLYLIEAGWPPDDDSAKWRMLYLSVVTATTLGYGDITPVTTPARLLVGMQSIIGLVCIGFFLNAVGRRSG